MAGDRGGGAPGGPAVHPRGQRRDRPGGARAGAREPTRIAAYGDTDLICYRATEPEGLRERQAEAWDPLLAWSAEALGAPLTQVVGLMPQDQPPASLAALRAAVAREDAFGLVALHDLVTLSGSLVIGLAVARGAIAADDAWALSRVDEAWQAELWGDDAEAEAAAALRRTDFLRAAELQQMLASRGKRCAGMAENAPSRRAATAN